MFEDPGHRPHFYKQFFLRKISGRIPVRPPGGDHDAHRDPDRHQNLIDWPLGHACTPPKNFVKTVLNFLRYFHADAQTAMKTLPFRLGTTGGC